MPLSQQDIQKFKDNLSKVAKSRVSEAVEVMGKALELLAQPELQKDPDQENFSKVEELLASLEANVTFLEGHGTQLQTTIGKLEEIRKEVATVQEYKEKNRGTYKPGHPEWKRLEAEIKAATVCSGTLDGVLTDAKSCSARETEWVTKRKTFKAEAAKIKAARDTVIRNLEENKIGTFIQNYCNFSNLVKDNYTELFFNELMEAQSKLLDKVFEDEGKWKKVEDGIKDRLKHFYPPDKDVFQKGDAAAPEAPAPAPAVAASVPPPPPTPPPPPALPAKAQLQVRIEPAGFAVQINGRDQGTAPVEISLESGSYTVRASLAGYPVQERKITLAPGQVGITDFGKIEPDPVKVEVISNPVGAAITLDGQALPQTTNAVLSLKPGREYAVRVALPNCQPMEKRVQVQIGRAERLEFAGFEAMPPRIRLQLEPPGAAVELNGRTLYVPLPEFLPVKSSGTNNLKVSLEGYQPQVREFTAQPGQEETLVFKLEKIVVAPEIKAVEAVAPKPPPMPPLPGPKPALLTVTSTPPGAEIWLNGQRFQNATGQPVLTPNTQAPLSLEPGRKQKVELRLAGHKPHSKEIEGLPGAAINTHIVMEKDAPRQATLVITSAPPGATIILNGKPVGQTSGNDLKVEPGNYKLEIAYKGYKTQQKQVPLKEGQVFRDHFNLEVFIETADVAFSSTPAEAEVRVDGKVLGKTNLSLKLAVGKRALEITLPGYKPVKQELQVHKEQPLQLDFELEAIIPPAVSAPPSLAPSGQTSPPFAPAKIVTATKATTSPPPPEVKPVPTTATSSGTQPPFKPEEKKEGKSKGVLVALVLLLLLGAGGFAVYKFFGSTESKPCKLVVNAGEGSHEVLIDGQVYSSFTPANITFPATDSRKKVKVSLRLQADYEIRGGDAEKTVDLVPGKDLTVAFDVGKKVATVGRMTVTTEPTGAIVYVDGRQRGVTLSTLEADIGIREVVVELSGYNPKTNRVTIRPGQIEMVSFQLEPVMVDLRVICDLRGAQVKLDGKILEQTTPAKINVSPGNHFIEVLRSGYKSATTNVLLAAGTRFFEVDLGKLEETGSGTPTGGNGILVVITEPEGATIWVDAKNHGSNLKSLELPPGEHEISAKLPGYLPKADKVTIKAGQTETLALGKLKAVPITVTVTSDPEGARLTLNSQKRKEKTPATLSLEPGNYSLTASLEEYQDASEQFTLVPNSPAKDIKFSLIKKGEPVKLPTEGIGKVSVITDPIGASIFVDGSRAPVGRTLTTLALPSGLHPIVVTMNGYRSKTNQVKVMADDLVTCNFGALEREGVVAPTSLTASIDSDPRGARIFLDGRDTGQVTPAQLSVKPGTAYEFKLELNGYKPYTAKLQVQPGGAHEFWYPLESASIPETPASMLITSTPKEAQIWTNNVDTGKTTPYNFDNVASGVPYVITVKFDGYEDAVETYILKPGKSEFINKTLVKKSLASANASANGGVEVSCNPSGADIYVDGQKTAQVTPATLPLLVGRHKIKVVRAGFGEAEKEFTVEAGVPQKLDFGVLSSGLVDVKVETTPPGAKIEIYDGLNRVASGEAGANFPLKPDVSYSIQAKMDGYEYDQKTVTPRAGVQNTVRLVLNPNPATLLVTSSPPVATIYVNGVKKGLIQTINGLSLPVKAGEKYRVEAEFTTGAKRKYQEVIPQPGETVKVHFTYK